MPNFEPSDPIVTSMLLTDWEAEDGNKPANPIHTDVSIFHSRIDLKFADGRSIWIEQQDGQIRIHAYLADHDDPLCTSMGVDQFSVLPPNAKSSLMFKPSDEEQA